MTDQGFSQNEQQGGGSQEETMSAHFANMVIQLANTAFMLLGKVPHPETGKIVRDLDSAKMFIDQLEMLAFKTQGNLDQREERLLNESLTNLRMAFVESAEGKTPEPSGAAPQQEPQQPQQPQQPAPGPVQPSPSEVAPQPPSEGEEPRKRFSKKY